MKHCRSCTILDKYDRLNAAGYCSWCVARGHDKRPRVVYDVSHRLVPCRGFKSHPTKNQAVIFKALVEYGTPAKVARALGRSVETICTTLKYLEKRIGEPVYIRPPHAVRLAGKHDVELTDAGERLIEQLSEVI